MFAYPAHAEDDHEHGLVFDDDETYAPDHSRASSGPAKAAAAKRAAAARSREWRERARRAAELDAALVDALTTIYVQALDGTIGDGIVSPSTVLMGQMGRGAFRILVWKGWDRDVANAALKARLCPGAHPTR
ncbi:hypothetical protein [Methylobacterium sp. 37f]|uniref:hypothetical protein n=1 Tax=Methylobacterium sp. 37f TaxID=2817058 RepID=UPI001FFC5BEE|nr:hypothetical protein [Methylobacterium sp. 37f]MCK2055291.1 hypothetical protein [Methylobacterium sp. 37f]